MFLLRFWGVEILCALTGLFFPAKGGGINTGEGALDSFMSEGEFSALDAAVDDAFEEVEENEYVELPDADRSDFARVDPPEDDEAEDPDEEDDDLAESVNERLPNEDEDEK